MALVFLIELFLDRGQLPTFELTDFGRAPSVSSADQRTEHQLQNRAFTEGIGNDLEATPLLNEQPLEQVGGADRSPMCHQEAQVGDAGFEVVHEAGNATLLL